MAADGDDDARIPTDFNECVSREELETANKLMLEKMDETFYMCKILSPFYCKKLSQNGAPSEKLCPF